MSSDQPRPARRTSPEPWRVALAVLVLALIAAFAATMCYVTAEHGRGTPALPAGAVSFGSRTP